MNSVLKHIIRKPPQNIPLSFRRPLSALNLQPPSPACLLITFDAFGTLIRPRFSVAEQYLLAARDSGLLVHHIPTDLLFSSFKRSIKEISIIYPNYQVITPTGPSSAREWWNRVVWQTFAPFIKLPSKAVDMSSSLFPTAVATAFSSGSEDGELHSNAVKMEQTCDSLWSRFCGRGYEAFFDVENLFARIERLRKALDPHVKIIMGIISNTDDRMPIVMESLGLMNTAESGSSQFKTDSNDLSATLSHRFRSKARYPFAALDNLSSSYGPIPNKQSFPEAATRRSLPPSIPFPLRVSETDPPPPLLDFVLTSHAVGHMKPDPAIFAEALRQATAKLGTDQPAQESSYSARESSRLSISPVTPFAKAIHIGDGPSTDVEGALGAGWDAILLDRKERLGVIEEQRPRLKPELKLVPEPSLASTFTLQTLKAIHLIEDVTKETKKAAAAGSSALPFEKKGRQVAGREERPGANRRLFPTGEGPPPQLEYYGRRGYESYGWRISDEGNDRRNDYDGRVPRVRNLKRVADLIEMEAKLLWRRAR